MTYLAIAEYEDGDYLPLFEAASVEEARELWDAKSEAMRNREDRCPERVVLWRYERGEYSRVDGEL